MPEPADVPVVGVSAAVVARAARSLFFRNDTSGVGQLCLEEVRAQSAGLQLSCVYGS